MNNKGQSLFEVVIAVGMVGAILVGVVSLAAIAVRNSVYTKNKTLAARYSQETTEWLRRERDSGVSAFMARADQTYCLSVLDWSKKRTCAETDADKVTATSLYREVILTGTAPMVATVRLYWTDGQGNHEARSVTYFSDWRER